LLYAQEGGGKDFPISVEINPHLTKAEDMIQAAKELSPISDNFVIKVPCNEQGLIAAKIILRRSNLRGFNRPEFFGHGFLQVRTRFSGI